MTLYKKTISKKKKIGYNETINKQNAKDNKKHNSDKPPPVIQKNNKEILIIKGNYMSEIMQTKKSVLKARCGYCPRVIFRSDETDGEFKQEDGKVICPVCRVTKLSKFKKEIKEDKKYYDAEKAKQEEISKAKSKQEVVDIAVASQIRAGRKYKLKSKK